MLHFLFAFLYSFIFFFALERPSTIEGYVLILAFYITWELWQ